MLYNILGQLCVHCYWFPYSEQIVVLMCMCSFYYCISNFDIFNELSRLVLTLITARVLPMHRYVVLWKKVDGQWKIYMDVWSSNTPQETQHDEL